MEPCQTPLSSTIAKIQLFSKCGPYHTANTGKGGEYQNGSIAVGIQKEHHNVQIEHKNCAELHGLPERGQSQHPTVADADRQPP